MKLALLISLYHTMQKIFEDNYILLVDKPAGIAVHPGAGETNPTVVDWLIDHYPVLKKLNWPARYRPGIVHRLDKDTSGILILAKDPKTLAKLQKQFADREVKKEYLTLVWGKTPKEGIIEAPIGRDRKRFGRQKAAYFESRDIELKPSQTKYQKIGDYRLENQLSHYRHPELGSGSMGRFRNKFGMTGGDILSLIKAQPQTGRTHQIRAHFKYLGFPIFGDQLYSFKPAKKAAAKLGLDRQFLHASKITFRHPKSGKTVSFESKLSGELEQILKKLTQCN